MEMIDSMLSHRYKGARAEKIRASYYTIRVSKAYHLDELL